MKIMVNLLPLKTGGGVQVALDFLRQAEIYGADHTWLIVARENGPFSGYPESLSIKLIHLVKGDLPSRIFFEYWGCKSLIAKYNPDLIYTQFGPQWPGSKATNVAGCAYSNLFYPEIDFWSALPPLKKTIKKIIDSQRLKRILSADVQIFETEDLAKRAREQYGLSSDSVFFVRAAASSLVTEDSTHEETKAKCLNLPVGYKLLLLSGYHPNKNIEFLVSTALEMKRRKISGVIFVLTLPEVDLGSLSILRKITDLGLEQYIYNIGPVPQAGCCELYRYCDAAILPSTLESFSNMIAESWEMKVPLFISDMSWCRSLCGNAAVYYNFLDCDSLIDQIFLCKGSEEFRENIIMSGRNRLSEYPSPKERFLSYLKIIENAA